MQNPDSQPFLWIDLHLQVSVELSLYQVLDSPMNLFPEIASRTSSPTISSPSVSDRGSPTELGMLISYLSTFS